MKSKSGSDARTCSKLLCCWGGAKGTGENVCIGAAAATGCSCSGVRGGGGGGGGGGGARSSSSGCLKGTQRLQQITGVRWREGGQACGREMMRQMQVQERCGQCLDLLLQMRVLLLQRLRQKC